MAPDRDREPDRLDLSPLAAEARPERFEAFVGRVMAAAADELARRRARLTVWSLLAGWRRPLLTAAGLAAAALTVMVMVGRFGSPAAAQQMESLAQAAGVPDEWAVWVQVERYPTPGELLALGQSDTGEEQR